MINLKKSLYITIKFQLLMIIVSLIGFDILEHNVFNHLSTLKTIPFIYLSYIIYKNKTARNLTAKIKTINATNVIFIIVLSIMIFYASFFFLYFRNYINLLLDIQTYNSNINTNNLNISYYLIIGIFITPVIEELLCRKMIFSSFIKQYNYTKSVLYSSLIFTLLHLPNIKDLVYVFLVGTVLAIIFEHTKNIIYTIILHSLLNFYRLLYIYLASNTNCEEFIYSKTYMVILTIILFLITLSLKNYKSITKSTTT
jgi:membrane protease YdiL (CAAX protease family)